MRTYRFYCEDLQSGPVELSRTESHHLISVMRSKAGDRVELFDGKGKTAGAVVDSISRKRATPSALRM